MRHFRTASVPELIQAFWLSATIITDVLLIVSPIAILRSARLDPVLYARLAAAVSISVLATTFTVIHVVLALTVRGIWAAIFAVVEVRTHQ